MPKKRVKQVQFSFFSLFLFLLSFGVDSPSLFAQSINIRITDCRTGKAIRGVYVVDGANHLLAKSDSTGDCRIASNRMPIFLEHYGYHTLALYEKSDLEKTICLKSIKHKLSTVVIKSKKGNIGNYLLKLRDKNLPLFITHDTTVYYHFTYTLDFPIKHWQETAKGYIAYHWQRHKSVLCEVSYVQYHYLCTDTYFWKSNYYKAVHPNGVYHVLRYNIMGNDAGYQLWKRLVNRGKGIRMPIPWFLVSREKRALMKKVNNNPKKYHLSQYIDEKRKLTLRLDSDQNQIFEAHYSNYATNRSYVTERLIFDSSGRLSSVFYFTPEQLSDQYFSLDSTTINSMNRMSKINNDSSYYYSRYTYDTQHNPILLKQVRHMDAFFVEGTPYRVSVKLNLVDTVPKKEIKIDAYHWIGRMIHNGKFIGLRKGLNVLNTINANK